MRPRSVPAIALAAGLAGCAARPAAVVPLWEPTVAEWRGAFDELGRVRASAGGAYTRKIALELREPRSGRVLSARGAVAVAPPGGLRMILLGPGGTTALDLWVQGDRFRFAVPAIDLKRRGDLRGPREERRGLPVDFLSFWLLRPAGGQLLWHGREEGAERFLLRDGAALVDLRVLGGGRIRARRTTWSADGEQKLDDETVEAEGLGCAEVRYHQRSTGLEVTVRCEGEMRGAPPARALADPEEEPS